MLVREALYEDVCSLTQLHKLCLPHSVISKLPNYFLKIFYKNAIKKNDFSVFIHEIDGSITGCLLLSKKGAFKTKHLFFPKAKIFDYFIDIRQLDSKKNGHMHSVIYPNIEFLYIHPEKRSLKCGTALLTYCKQVHSTLSVCTVNRTYNRAIKFYRRNNFKDYEKLRFLKKEFLMLKWETDRLK